MPVTFAMGWYFAARLKRVIVAIILGIVSGPVAMATWAISSMPDGYIAEHFLPLEAIGIHSALLTTISILLIVLGFNRSKTGSV